MPLDASIYSQLKPVQMENPLALYLKSAQLNELASKGSLNALQMKKLEREIEQSGIKNQLMARLFPEGEAPDSRPYNALAMGAERGSIGPTMQNASALASMPAPSKSAGPSMDMNVLSRLAAMGMKTDDLLNIHKYTNDPKQRVAGSYYEHPQTGKREYYADPNKGLTIDPGTNQVSQLGGFSAANAAIKGAETEATESVKARHQLLPLGYVGQDGRPIGGSVSDYLGAGQSPLPQPSIPQPGQLQQGFQPAFVGHDILMQLPPDVRQKIVNNAQADGASKFNVNYKLPNGRVIQGEVDMSRDHAGNVPAIYQQKFDHIRSQATPEERQQFEQQAIQGLQRIKDPGKRSEAIRDFYTQLAEPPGTPIRMIGSEQKGAAAVPGERPTLQSEVEREQTVGAVKVQNAVDEKRLKDKQERLSKDTRLYEQINAAIPMVRKLLQNATGSGAGAVADQVMAFFGKSTKGAEAAQALDTIGGWMVSNVPRMEGPQSNFDVLNYQTMAGRVADRTLPNEVRLEALNVLETLQKKYANINGVSTGESAQPASPAPAQAASIPEGAAQMLRANPALRQQFDQKYGPGASVSILGN